MEKSGVAGTKVSSSQQQTASCTLLLMSVSVVRQSIKPESSVKFLETGAAAKATPVRTGRRRLLSRPRQRHRIPSGADR